MRRRDGAIRLHSPTGRVSILTFERFWRLLAGVVDDLSAVE
jgi:hypothetical protein